ncbi:hemolysin activation/secretion protein [Rhodoferax ferrireducens]|uniref:Hemolysin activation/secretion protein n=1 Tax=Rhodoferax ferrireducens TaxID=192843 RepID=A0ABU2CAS4_9BURK|nr:ShlB/FhaC/HecB family hemolysin secretion/activation protein [Rhodoferax ferrireducens]MDR7378433.1 hemolysin activation/secretion protein [Rhodoferax ferrireducens]
MCSLLLCAFSSASWAQTSPPSNGPDPSQEQRRQQEREQIERERLQPSPDVRLPSPPASADLRLPIGEAPCFVLQDITLRGDLSERFGWILEALNGPQHDDSPHQRCLGAQGIALLVQRAQQALVDRGYVTSRVLTEPQDFKSGHLALTLLPGRIHAIRFAPGTVGRATALNAVPAKVGDILNLRDVEQALENFKRLPSAEADIQIEPAEAPGSSDLVIRWQQALPFRLSLTADDGGSQGTGKNQGSITLSYDHWWTLNDLFYITYNRNLDGALGHSALRGHAAGDATDGAHGTQGHTVHYSVPWGYWLLGLTHSQNRYYQSVAGANQSIVYSGSSSNAELKLSRLVYRDQARKTTVSVRAFQRTSNNYIDDTEVEVQRRVVGGWEAAVAQRVFMGSATLDANAAFKHGTGAFGALPAPEEGFGEGTSRFKLVTADLSLNSPFAVAGLPLRYSGSWRAQWNRTPLTPQDRFAIGGRNTVRGFDGESSLSAEHGWLLRQELSVPLGQSGQDIYLGLDHGEVGGFSSQFLVGRRLTGAVIGLRGSVKGLGYELFAGRPVKRPEGFRTAGTTAGFSLSLSF